MRRPLTGISRTTPIAGVVLALALAGCGGGAKKAGSIPFASNGVEGGQLASRYTCDGANISPPFKWGAVPAGTIELVLVAIGKGPSAKSANTIEWAMGGLKPALGELTAGQVPSGAFLETNSSQKRQYSICPPKGQTKEYAFVLFAVPKNIIVTPRVNGPTLYHNLTESKPEFKATASGAVTASYSRK
jgi:phosphatidylethanolamine-binding protein (PEBP) family uncharacterized protein